MVMHKSSHMHPHHHKDFRKIKTAWVMEFTGRRVFREHDRLKRSVVKSRAPLSAGMYSLFGGVRVP